MTPNDNGSQDVHPHISAQTAFGEPAAAVVEEADVPVARALDLRRYIASRLVSNIGLTNAIWVIFLHERGLSLAQIGLAEAAFHLAPVTLELPTGSMADTYGRKWSLAMDGLMSAIAALLMLGVNGIWLKLPAMYFAGAAMTFASGAQEAFLYDSMAAGNSSAGSPGTPGGWWHFATWLARWSLF